MAARGRILAWNSRKVGWKGAGVMCERFEVSGSELRGPIVVEFTRDASVRQTEIIIVNHNPDGFEVGGMRVICYDNGRIRGGETLVEGADIIGRAEMRG